MSRPIMWDDRTDLLKILPKNSIGAELGVWKGEYSEELLQIVQPSILHLVDAWDALASELNSKSPQIKFSERYQLVCDKFQTIHMFK